MRINEEFIENIEDDDLLQSSEETPEFGGSYDMVIYINLWNDSMIKDVVSRRVMKFLSATPAVSSAERLEVVYNYKDGFDHIQTSDYDYKCFNTFAQSKAPNSIAFGIKGKFKNNLRAAMSIFRSLWSASSTAHNFTMISVPVKSNENPTSICFNIRLVGVILEYIQTGNWTIDRSGEFNINYNQFSLVLQYITNESMEDVQEFLFSRYKIMEIYLANDRCVNIGQTNGIWIAKEATALLRSQTNVLSPDKFIDAIVQSRLAKTSGWINVKEVSLRSHILKDFLQDGAYFNDKTYLDRATAYVLSYTDFPQFAAIGTRRATSEFELVVPAQIYSFDDEPGEVYIKVIVINANSIKWFSPLLRLLYPDITDEQSEDINDELIKMISG